MTAAWGIYALLVGALVSAAAGLAETVLMRLRRSTRWLWVAAMLATLAIPVVRFTSNGRAVPPDAALRLPDATRAMASRHVPGPAPLPGPAAHSWWTVQAVRGLDALLTTAYDAAGTGTSRRDRFLVAAWMVLSVCVAAGWLRAARRITRLRRTWGEQLVDGVPVLLSDDVGPAVLGVRRPRTVLPRWILDLDAPQRALVLGHEAEHVRARDPLLLAFGFLCTILVPWQAWLWFQLRRLRLAVETDCDARVLSRFPDVRRYGSLLLFVGQRAAFPSPAPALAGVLSLESHLARRITAMTRPTRKGIVSKLAGLSMLVVLCGAAVIAAPVPQGPSDSNVPSELVGLYQMQAPTAETRSAYMGRGEITFLRLAADGRSRLENVTMKDSATGLVPSVQVGPWHRNPWSVRPAATPPGAAANMDGKLCFDAPDHHQPCDFYRRDARFGVITLYAAPPANTMVLRLLKMSRP